MAISDILQIIADARVDARSLSEFVFKPADFMVERRLGGDIHTLKYYLDNFDETKTIISAYVATIPTIVNDAINNTAVEGGVLADTFVTATANGAGAVARTQRDINSERVSIKTFGIVGDGIADDTLGVEKAIKSGQSIDWLDVKLRITRPIAAIYNAGTLIKWRSNGAVVIYDGAHAEYAIRLSGINTAYDLDCNLTIDGSKLVNKALEALSETSSMGNTQTSKFYIDNMIVKNIKRNKLFSGGDAINVRGGFSVVEFGSGLKVENCELPVGQGTVSIVGVSGITVDFYSINAYVRKVIYNGSNIEKVYSSDLSYEHDQDGLRYFAPKKADGDLMPSEIVVTGNANFKNCYGRSIKTQCMITKVDGATFERSEGFASGVGNPEINVQLGYLSTDNLTFIYSNNQVPSMCIGSANELGIKASGFNINKANVYLDGATVLKTFLSTFPRDSQIAPSTIDNVSIFGEVNTPIDYLVNGFKNKLSISNFFVAKITDNAAGKALVKVKASGGLTPFYAYLDIKNCTYAGANLPTLVLDNIAGEGAASETSSQQNTGFADSKNGTYSPFSAKNMQLARLPMLGKPMPSDITAINDSTTGFFGISDTKELAPNVVTRFKIKNTSGALLLITTAYDKSAFAMIYSFGKTNSVINKGSTYEVGDGAEPATGAFRVWSENNNELCIKNADGSSRVTTVFVLSTR